MPSVFYFNSQRSRRSKGNHLDCLVISLWMLPLLERGGSWWNTQGWELEQGKTQTCFGLRWEPDMFT